jgi:hypothetical protein
MARFPVTYCSNCGKAFGPGDHGFSHCKHHNGMRSLTAREESAALDPAQCQGIDPERRQ